jgi:uncharacterized SAM-binding protein YcdF (DUF218 family)
MPFSWQSVYQLLVHPLVPVFAFLLFLLCKRERTRRNILVLLLYLYAVSIPYTPQRLLEWWAVPDTVEDDRRYGAAVVLGGIIDYKWYQRHSAGREKEMFQHLSCYHHIGQSAARILMGVAVLKGGQAERLLLNNVQLGYVDETAILLDFLRKQGVGEEQVVVHGRVRDTLAEAESVRKYCAEQGIGDILLITSANHMRRAAGSFRKQGLTPALLSVSREEGPVTWESFVPSAAALGETYRMLYEMSGFLVYRLQGKL